MSVSNLAVKSSQARVENAQSRDSNAKKNCTQSAISSHPQRILPSFKKPHNSRCSQTLLFYPECLTKHDSTIAFVPSYLQRNCQIQNPSQTGPCGASAPITRHTLSRTPCRPCYSTKPLRNALCDARSLLRMRRLLRRRGRNGPVVCRYEQALQLDGPALEAFPLREVGMHLEKEEYQWALSQTK